MMQGSEEALDKLNSSSGGGAFSKDSKFGWWPWIILATIVIWFLSLVAVIYTTDRYQPFSLSERIVTSPWDALMVGAKGCVAVSSFEKSRTKYLKSVERIHLYGHWLYYKGYATIKSTSYRPFDVWSRVALSKTYKDAALLSGVSDVKRLSKISHILNSLDRPSKQQ